MQPPVFALTGQGNAATISSSRTEARQPAALLGTLAAKAIPFAGLALGSLKPRLFVPNEQTSRQTHPAARLPVATRRPRNRACDYPGTNPR